MRIVVADHHMMAGNIPFDRGPNHPLQYPVELARFCGAPPLGRLRSNWLFKQIEDKGGLKYRAAKAAVRIRSVDCFVSTSEQVGFPLALLNRRRIRHVMIAHNLATRFKDTLQACFAWMNWPDELVVFSRALADHVTEIGVDVAKVHVFDHPVDVEFYRPETEREPDPSLIVAVGREHRDYLTLMTAMSKLPKLRAIIVANSPWAKRAAVGEPGRNTVRMPSNVRFEGWLSPLALRDLYTRAAVVVVPILNGVRFGAGTNVVAEAQAMGKPLVVTEVPGLLDYLDDGCVLPVAAADPAALAAALKFLVNDAAARREMGRNARRLAETRRMLSGFNQGIAQLCRGD